MQVVYLTFINNFITFMPLFISIYVIADMNAKKTYFTMALFNVNCIGGYITFKNMQINIHLTEKFVVNIDIIKDVEEGKAFVKIKHIELYKFKSLLNCGVKSNFMLNFSGIWWAFSNAIAPIIYEKKDFTTINNDIVFIDGDKSTCFIEIGILANLFSINMIIFDYILMRIKEYVKGKQQGKRYNFGNN